MAGMVFRVTARPLVVIDVRARGDGEVELDVGEAVVLHEAENLVADVFAPRRRHAGGARVSFLGVQVGEISCLVLHEPLRMLLHGGGRRIGPGKREPEPRPHALRLDVVEHGLQPARELLLVNGPVAPTVLAVGDVDLPSVVDHELLDPTLRRSVRKLADELCVDLELERHPRVVHEHRLLRNPLHAHVHVLAHVVRNSPFHDTRRIGAL